MPRVILRTVEPAKLLACQSVEKRCTRMKASRDTSDMIRSVNGTIACSPIRRSIIEARPSATMARERRRCRAARGRIGRARGHGVDQTAGEQRHEQVGHGGAEQAAGNDGGAGRLIEPVAEHERQHHADRGGALVGERSWRHPAALGAHAGSIVDARTASGRTRASLKNSSDLPGSLGDRDVRPDRCWRKAALKGPKRASSMGFGREGAICEYDEIMQILPGSSDDAVLINASRVICNNQRCSRGRGISAPVPMPKLRPAFSAA